MRYRSDPAEDRVLVEIEGLSLIYHRPSGVTHILAPPAPQLIEVLTEPLTFAELMERLTGAFQLEGEGDQAELVRARLEELRASGLVRAQ